jgi:hypothetical protein
MRMKFTANEEAFRNVRLGPRWLRVRIAKALGGFTAATADARARRGFQHANAFSDGRCRIVGRRGFLNFSH